MHQNTLERVTVFLVLLLAAGLFNAKMAAAFGLVWLLARVIYSVGYYSGTPSNRIVGSMVSRVAQIKNVIVLMTYFLLSDH